MRSIKLSRRAYLPLAQGDLLYIGILISSFALLAVFHCLTLEFALASLSVAAITSAFLSRVRLTHRVSLLRLPTMWRLLIKRGGHSLVASQAGWLQSQGYIWITTSMLSLETLGRVAGARILIAPVFTVLTAWVKTSLPSLSGERNPAAISKHVKRSLLNFALGLGAIAVALSLAGDEIGRVLFNGRLGDIRPFSLLWVFVAAATAARTIAVTALRAREQHAYLTRLFFIGAVLAQIGCVSGIAIFGAYGALLGLAIAEAVVFVVGILRLRKDLNLNHGC